MTPGPGKVRLKRVWSLIHCVGTEKTLPEPLDWMIKFCPSPKHIYTSVLVTFLLSMDNYWTRSNLREEGLERVHQGMGGMAAAAGTLAPTVREQRKMLMWSSLCSSLPVMVSGIPSSWDDAAHIQSGSSLVLLQLNHFGNFLTKYPEAYPLEDSKANLADNELLPIYHLSIWQLNASF